jgi:FtsP/CotA-like multicopper oxidase with cupredoxin domain
VKTTDAPITERSAPEDTDVPPPIDYDVAEGLRAADGGRQWTLIGTGLAALVAVMALVVALVALGDRSDGDTVASAPRATPAPAAVPAADKPAPTLADSKGVSFEKFQQVDPKLPPVPPGPVKKFNVDVMQHVTQVSPDLAPTEAWTYVVNGKTFRGTAASEPMVVNEGDKVKVTFVNGGSKAMAVTMPHSIDLHSAEVAPSKYYVDVEAGKKLTFDFVAKHPGVFMYHCATQPVLAHTSNGMSGMMVVKPKGLPTVDRELWMTQSEYYLGAPGKPADMAKMAAEKPDVIAFNGYANQYKTHPITVRKGERVRMYVLNAGPSKWSAFHVIGTVFDKTTVEGIVGHDSQTVNLAPSQGGWMDFTLDQEGNYPFVTHAFGDMAKGAAGMLHTSGAPMPKAAPAPKPATAGGVGITLGDMWIKSTVPSVNAGKVSFNVTNQGQTTHGFAIVPSPAKVSGGLVDESTFVASGEHLAAGASGTVTADLKSGTYELICHIPGHYAAGQKMTFEVK